MTGTAAITTEIPVEALVKSPSETMFARTKMVPQKESPPLLEEAMDMAALTMLLNFFSLLRDRSSLGFTKVLFHKIKVAEHDDDDVEAVVEDGHHESVRTTVSVFRHILEELEDEALQKHDNKEEDISAHSAFAKDFVDWVEESRIKDTDLVAKAAIQKLKSQVARARWKRLYHIVCAYNRLKKIGAEVHRLGRDDPNALPEDAPVVGPPITTSAKSLDLELEERRQKLKQSDSTLDSEGSWFTSQKRLVEDHFATTSSAANVTVTMNGADMNGHSDSSSRGSTPSKRLSLESQRQESQGLLQLESQSVQSFMDVKRKPCRGLMSISDRKRLQDYRPNKSMINRSLEASLQASFEKDSFAARLIHLQEEIVFVNDKNANDIVYYITINQETSTVTVVFRGFASGSNWLSALHLGSTEYVNPVEEPYDEIGGGRSEHVRFFTDYAVHLLKKRRRGKRKLYEILDHVQAIGVHLRAEDGKYKLAVTGHGVGAALATICSFYAACDERFLTMGPVRTCTFASPRVGDYQFLKAYRHLEQTGRLVHARFCNQHDIATAWPLGYHHVGLQVRLHGRDLVGESLMQFGLFLSYPDSDEWTDSIPRALANNVFSQMSIPGGTCLGSLLFAPLCCLTKPSTFLCAVVATNHRLSEYYRRLDKAKYHHLELQKTGTTDCSCFLHTLFCIP